MNHDWKSQVKSRGGALGTSGVRGFGDPPDLQAEATLATTAPVLSDLTRTNH